VGADDVIGGKLFEQSVELACVEALDGAARFGEQRIARHPVCDVV